MQTLVNLDPHPWTSHAKLDCKFTFKVVVVVVVVVFPGGPCPRTPLGGQYLVTFFTPDEFAPLLIAFSCYFIHCCFLDVLYPGTTNLKMCITIKRGLTGRNVLLLSQKLVDYISPKPDMNELG